MSSSILLICCQCCCGFLLLAICYLALPAFYEKKDYVINIHNLLILYIFLKAYCRHSGAGVNAVQKFGMSPLSELVWSPDEGLSIKIAASSLSTRKASLRWNADTLSIVISSPQQSGAGGAKSSDNIYDNQEVLEKIPSQLRARSDSSVRVTTNPNRIANLDALQSMSMRSQEQDSSKSKRRNLIQ